MTPSAPPPPQSPELTAFYRAWLAWAESGAPRQRHMVFVSSSGLCRNARLHAAKHPGMEGIVVEMKAQFESEGLDRDYPFGQEQYDEDLFRCTMHLDPNRLAWVRSRTGAMPKAPEQAP